MATQLQVRRGTTAQMNAFTGAEGEIAVNTSTDTVHVHDGSTAGGFALAKADGSNIGTYAGSFTTLAASGAVTLSSTLDVSSTGEVISTVRSTSTSGARQATLRLNVASTGGDDPAGRVQFTYGTGYTVAGSIEMTHTNPAMKFLTGSTVAMLISGSNVGIGNLSPSSYFSNARNLVVGGTTGANGMTISGSTDTQIFFADGTSGADAYRGIIRYSHADNGFSFWTNATRVLDIDSSGNVGIGTSSPSSQLEIDELGSGDATIKVGNAQNVYTTNVGKQGATAYGATAAGAAFLYTFDNDISIMSDGAAGSIKFTTGGNTQKMVLDASGNVGIGIAPSVKLEVNGGADGSVVFSGRSDGGNGNNQRFNLIAFADGGGSGYGGGLKIQTRSSTNVFSDSITVTSAGKLGISNPNPAQTLSICNPANPNRNGMEIAIGASDTSSNTIQNYNRATGAYTPLNIVGNILTFGSGTSAQEALRIDGSRNVLVGKSALEYENTAGHIFRNDGFQSSSRSGGNVADFNRLSSNGEIIRFSKDGATVGSVDVDANVHIAINAASGTGKLKVGGVVRYNWDANQFYPQQDNARDLGFPSFRWDDVYSTGGINTSDRNEKQDIEELSNAEKRVAVACKGLMRKFRWKSAVIDKGDDARIHVGIMAQDLQAAFESEGLDPARYGMWCSNTWTDEETGEEITRMSVRYNELLAFIISAT